MAFAYFYVGQRRTVPLTNRDTIVLADFVNTTGDTVFDSALKQGLAVQLEQSPFLSILPDVRVRETLRLMEKPADERITRDIAREICLRQGASAYIAGSIAPLGKNYVIGLEAVESQTGEVIAREQNQSSSKEEVLKRLSELSTDLRRRLGESLSSIRKFDAPLQATTASLDALKAYAAGVDATRKGKYAEAIPRFKAAIERDPDFALVYQALSGSYRNMRQPHLARECAEKAFALRDRVTERERLRIAYSYYRTVTVELDRAREAMEQLRDAYPREPTARANLAVVYMLLGRPQEAVQATEEAIHLGSNSSATRGNLSFGLVQLNRFAEAREAAEAALREGMDSDLLRISLFWVAYINRDQPAMNRLLEETGKRHGGHVAVDWQARVAVFEGRLRESQELALRSARMADASGNPAYAFGIRAEAAWNAALFGNCTAARSLRPPEDLSDIQDEDTIETVATALAMCHPAGAATIVGNVSRQYPKSTLLNGRTLPLARAILALQRQDAQAAIDALGPASRFDASAAFRTGYFRGLAYLSLKSSSQASAEFQAILDHRGQDVLSPLYVLAHLGLARAARLAGDPSKARREYQEFLNLWRDADSGLEPLRAARQEYEGLRTRLVGENSRGMQTIGGMPSVACAHATIGRG